MLAFTRVYFFESRLFNGLRPFGVKKICVLVNSRFRLWAKRLNSNLLSASSRPGLLQEHEGPISDCERYSTNSVFRKENVWISATARTGRAGLLRLGAWRRGRRLPCWILFRVLKSQAAGRKIDDFMTVLRSRLRLREARPVARMSRASHPPSRRGRGRELPSRDRVRA
jgi:hypothetical protein